MPSRTLREAYATSDAIASLPPGPQDRFPRYLLAADDHGCFVADLRVLKGRLWIKRDDMTVEQIRADLDAFAASGVLTLWSEGGKAFAHFKGWLDHQRAPRASAKRSTPVPPTAGQLRAVPERAVPGSAGQLPEVSPSSSSSSSDLPLLSSSGNCVPAGPSDRAIDSGGETGRHAAALSLLRALAESLNYQRPDWFVAHPDKIAAVSVAVEREIKRLGLSECLAICRAVALETKAREGDYPKRLTYYVKPLSEAGAASGKALPGEPGYGDTPEATTAMNRFLDKHIAESQGKAVAGG